MAQISRSPNSRHGVGQLVGATITVAAIFNGGLDARAADQWIDATATLLAPCNAPSSVQAVYENTLSIPQEIEFLLGDKGVLAHETAQFEEMRFGAHTPTSITATPGANVLASGFTNSGIGIRLVIDEKHFCVDHPKIIFTYEMTDALGTQLPGFRVTLLAGTAQQDLTLTKEGHSLTMNKIDEKYGKDFKFFIDDSFAWLDAHLDPNRKGTPKNEYCQYCYNERLRLRMVMVLARFLGSVDPMKIVGHEGPRPLSTWSGNIVFRGRPDFGSDGIFQSHSYNPISVDLEFSNDDVLSFVDDGYDGKIALGIREIKHHGKLTKLNDE